MKHLFSADVSLGRNSLGHLSIQEGRSMYMKYPLPYVCESLSLSVSQSPSQAGACSPPQVQCAHTHMCTTLPRHLRLIQELLTEPSTHIHLPQAHLPSQNIPSAGTYHWRKEGRPPSSCLSVSLSWRIPLLPHPTRPQHTPWLCSAFPWIHLSSTSWDHFIQSQFSLSVGWDWNPKLWISFHILPHLLGFTWWTRWAAFLSFVRKHPKPHLSFFPSKPSDLLLRRSSQDDISQSKGAGYIWPPGVKWDRTVLRPNIFCVLEQITAAH